MRKLNIYVDVCIHILFSHMVCPAPVHLAREPRVIYTRPWLVACVRIVQGPRKSQKESSENICSLNYLPSLVPGRRVGVILLKISRSSCVPICSEKFAYYYMILKNGLSSAESVFSVISSLPCPTPTERKVFVVVVCAKSSSVGEVGSHIPATKGGPV